MIFFFKPAPTRPGNLTIKDEEIIIENFNGRVYETEVEFKNIQGSKVGINLRKGNDNSTVFYYDIKDRKLVLDRSNSGEDFASQYGREKEPDEK